MEQKEIGIVVRLTFEGVHSWPDCRIPEVEFLRYPHRHVFHVEARKKVHHEEREVEIIMLKRRIENYCLHHLKGPHTSSCETMAARLLETFALDYCEVLEDGENGAYAGSVR